MRPLQIVPTPAIAAIGPRKRLICPMNVAQRLAAGGKGAMLPVGRSPTSRCQPSSNEGLGLTRAECTGHAVRRPLAAMSRSLSLGDQAIYVRSRTDKQCQLERIMQLSM
jgi:hypothetical protein